MCQDVNAFRELKHFPRNLAPPPNRSQHAQKGKRRMPGYGGTKPATAAVQKGPAESDKMEEQAQQHQLLRRG
eukprot:scaffold146651_cov15-Tisochrysis_lutea.AAC.1